MITMLTTMLKIVMVTNYGYDDYHEDFVIMMTMALMVTTITKTTTNFVFLTIGEYCMTEPMS